MWLQEPQYDRRIGVMFEKIRKMTMKAKKEPDRICVLYARSLDAPGIGGWILLDRGNGRQAHICTDCAYKTYETVDEILETYEQIALSAVPEIAEEVASAGGLAQDGGLGNLKGAYMKDVQRHKERAACRSQHSSSSPAALSGRRMQRKWFPLPYTTTGSA